MKKVLALAMFSLFSQAHALEAFTGPFQLECRGSEGSVAFSRDAGATSIQYGVHALGHDFSGTVQAYQESGKSWQEGSATIIDPDYEPSKWLSISAIHGIKKWHPAHAVCRPTRVIDECFPGTEPAYESNDPTEWLNVMINVSDPTQATFMSLDLGDLGYVKTLGQNTMCVLTH